MSDKSSPWETIASEYVVRNPPWLTLRRDHVRLPNDQEIDGYWVMEQPDWVNVVAVTDDKKIVLVRQYRHAAGRSSLELPGGYVDDETPLEAGRRELREETGYGDGSWTSLPVLSPNPALQDNRLHCFAATGVRWLGAATPDDTEKLHVELHHRDAIPSLIGCGEIFHALQVAPLLAYLTGLSQK